MQIVVSVGQTIMDIAVQRYGSAAAAVDIAKANGLSIADSLTPGTSIICPDDLSYDTYMENYVASENVCPATGYDQDSSPVSVGVFSDVFANTYE